MSSGSFDAVSKGLAASLDRDRVLKVLERRDRDRLCKCLVLPPLLDRLALSNLSLIDPFGVLWSPEYVLLCKLFVGEVGARPRCVLERLSLSSKSLGAALINMFSLICDTSDGVMPITLTYPAAEPYFLFMYSIVLCIV